VEVFVLRIPRRYLLNGKDGETDQPVGVGEQTQILVGCFKYEIMFDQWTSVYRPYFIE
jgi:hypothetical protein